MPQPPIDPDSFDKVNFVIDSWTTGCDAPWYIFIETMKPALLTAFITLITFGMDDVFRGFFRPRGLGGRRTGKRKGKWSRRIPRFPELGELLGSKIPGATEVKGKRWSILGKTLWRIDTVMQQAFFYWLVVDVVEDFAFDWTSLLYKSYWCQPDPPGAFSARSGGWGLVPNNVWKLVAYSVLDYNRGPPSWGHQSGGTGANAATVTAVLNVRKRAGQDRPTAFTVRVLVKETGRVLAQNGPNDTDADGNVTGICSGVVPPYTAFEVRCFMTGADWADYGDGCVLGVENLE